MSRAYSVEDRKAIGDTYAVAIMAGADLPVLVALSPETAERLLVDAGWGRALADAVARFNEDKPSVHGRKGVNR